MAFVIAVDGPAASGKGTVASRLATLYGYPMLDTGLLYRAVGVRLLSAAAIWTTRTAAEAAAKGLDLAELENAAGPHPRRRRGRQPGGRASRRPRGAVRPATPVHDPRAWQR
jgi:cytidylate kinase